MTGAREAALEVLTACRKTDAWVDAALKSTLRRSKLDPRDAALASRITYGVVQNRMLLDYYLDKLCKSGTGDLEPVILDILRIGACQILLLDRIPHSAAVNEAVSMAKAHRRSRAAGMVNAVLRNLSRSKDTLQPPADLPRRTSHPKWLVDRYVELLGREEAERCLAANNDPAPMTVQVNTLKTTPAALTAELQAAGIAVTPNHFLEGCLLLEGAGDIEALPAFAEGRFLVQDAAARLAVLAMDCRPGMRLIDACAAPGGKSFAAAMDMEDRGEIAACDIHPHKIRLIERGAERLGITCLRARLADGRQRREDFLESADRVLCDVPCSGLGIIRKKPDIRYKAPEALSGLPEVQLAILRNAGDYVKPGGLLLYSTCTILPEENEKVVEAFLAGAPDFSREIFILPGVGACPGEITLWPHRHQTDGFYICKLRKQL